jgi:uncharacterized RDD family membrane protein YckC
MMDTPEHNSDAIENDYVYAGFWWRFLASVIDTVFLSILLFPLIKIFATGNPMSFFGLEPLAEFILTFLLPMLVVVVFWRYRAATPGKILCKLRVIDTKTGGDLTIPQSILRFFAYNLSALPLMLGFIWVAFDKKKRAVHDMVSKTYVIRDAS